MREYRLVRDFNFIILDEVSQSVLLMCTQAVSFANNRNKFSNLSVLVAQTLWVLAGILLGSLSCPKNTMTLLKMLFIKLKSC